MKRVIRISHILSLFFCGKFCRMACDRCGSPEGCCDQRLSLRSPFYVYLTMDFNKFIVSFYVFFLLHFLPFFVPTLISHFYIFFLCLFKSTDCATCNVRKEFNRATGNLIETQTSDGCQYDFNIKKKSGFLTRLYGSEYQSLLAEYDM